MIHYTDQHATVCNTECAAYYPLHWAHSSLQYPLLPGCGAVKPHSDAKAKNALNNAVVKVYQQRYWHPSSLEASQAIKVLLGFFFPVFTAHQCSQTTSAYYKGSSLETWSCWLIFPHLHWHYSWLFLFLMKSTMSSSVLECSPFNNYPIIYTDTRQELYLMFT